MTTDMTAIQRARSRYTRRLATVRRVAVLLLVPFLPAAPGSAQEEGPVNPRARPAVPAAVDPSAGTTTRRSCRYGSAERKRRSSVE